MVNKNSMRISRNPEFFVSDLMKPGKKQPLGIADLSFFDQITDKYGHTAGFIKTQLYYLYFPKQIKFSKKNLSINFFIHSHFGRILNLFPAIVKNVSYLHRNFIENRQEDIFPTKIPDLLKAPLMVRSKINLHFQVSRHSHDKARGGRIASYLTDEQGSHAGWIGASKCEVIFERALRFNLSSQPFLRFQNIAIRSVKKLIKINHESAKVQKHEIRPGNQVANIFFHDTSFFTYPRLNPISNRADRNIVEKKSKLMHNLVISEVTGPEKNYISISHPNCRPFLIHPYLQNPRNRITIPPVLLNVSGHIFAKRSAAGRQARSDWINHISPASESDTDILFFSDFLRGGQKRLKFYEKQSRQRSKRHGGMELATLPYTGVSSRIKSFAKPGSIKFSPAVPPFLRMEISNKSNVEQRISGFPEKDLSYYITRSRTHHITTIANLFRHTDVHTRVKYFFKSYLTEFPVTSESRRREIFNLYDNVTNEKQSNISKEAIARPISLIPFDKTAALIADLPPLPAVFSKSPLMHENPFGEAKNADFHPKKRARTHHITTIANLFRHSDVHTRVKSFLKSYFTEFPVTSASRRRELFNFYNNVTNKKQSNISKETIARPISLIPFDRTAALIADLPPLPAVFSKSPLMRENPLLEAKDADFHPKKRARKQPIGSDITHFDKKPINRMRYIPFSDYNFTYRFPDKTINNPPSPEGSISTQEPSMAGYRNNFPDMTYFSSNISPHSTHVAGSGEGKKKTEFLKVDSSYKTDHTKLLSVPEPDLYGLADKVYGLIVERIKRERELRGR